MLTASDGASGDGLGASVATSGSTVVAGTLISAGAGKAYVFTEPASGWASESEAAVLNASDAIAGDGFGRSVAESADGRTVAVSAPFVGVAYVFSEPAGGWASEDETAELTPPSGVGDLGFGLSLAVSDDGSAVVAGSPDESVGANQEAGVVYVFARPPGGWVSEDTAVSLTATDGAQHDALGSSVALSRGAIVAGAPNDEEADAGQVYVFGQGPDINRRGMLTEPGGRRSADELHGDGHRHRCGTDHPDGPGHLRRPRHLCLVRQRVLGGMFGELHAQRDRDRGDRRQLQR